MPKVNYSKIFEILRLLTFSKLAFNMDFLFDFFFDARVINIVNKKVYYKVIKHLITKTKILRNEIDF